MTDEQWRAAATKGGDPGAPLEAEVEPGLTARWLYVPEDRLAPDPAGVPGQAPYVRGTRDGAPWRVRQACAQPERRRANVEILEDLNEGVGEVALHLDRGDGGVAVFTLDDLAEVLSGVHLDLAPVALDAGAAAIPAAALLAALWRREGVPAERAAGALRLDPLGTLAATGRLARAPEEEIALAAAVAAEVDATYPAPAVGADSGEEQAPSGVTALAVDTGAYVAAGASAAWELAIAIASGVEYLRAGERAGLVPRAAAARLEFTLTAGPDQFLEIAKFRAVRRLWARVLEASGVEEEARHSPTYARTSERMLSDVDPWTNMLRVTTAAFAAGLGGADGVTVAPFDRVRAEAVGALDAADGQPGTDGQAAAPGHLGRRIARNTQTILQEESGLGRLADPAAGSWYVESLTDDLAKEAWRRFVEIEREGGMLAALHSGRVASELSELADRRQHELNRRERLMTGVNIYPLLGDDGVQIEPVDREALARLDAARQAERPPLGEDATERLATTAAGAITAAAPDAGTDGSAPDARSATGPDAGTDGSAPAAAGVLAAAVELAEAGARIDEIAAALAGEPFTQEPLPPRRDAEAFERLRAAVAGHVAAGGEPPRLLLACLGPIARHVGAANWAKSFFESGGIEALNSVTEAAKAAGIDAADPAAAALAAAKTQAAPAADDPAAAPAAEGAATAPAYAAPEELGATLAASGARIAAVCAGRDEDAAAINRAVASLREAGAEYVYLATPTAEQAEGTEADEVVRDGVEMGAVLGAALERLGLDPATLANPEARQ